MAKAINVKINLIDDRRLWDQLVKDFKVYGNSRVTIGVHSKLSKGAKFRGSEKYPDSDATVAEVAFFNEFGTRRAPERSFIRSTVDAHQNEYFLMVKNLTSRIIKQSISVQGALDAIGFRVVNDIKTKILTGPFVANAPSTIKKKGFNRPLIDSQRLLNSIGFQAFDGTKKGKGEK